MNILKNIIAVMYLLVVENKSQKHIYVAFFKCIYNIAGQYPDMKSSRKIHKAYFQSFVFWLRPFIYLFLGPYDALFSPKNVT
jgi:hypothetical protein